WASSAELDAVVAIQCAALRAQFLQGGRQGGSDSRGLVPSPAEFRGIGHGERDESAFAADVEPGDGRLKVSRGGEEQVAVQQAGGDSSGCREHLRMDGA